MMDCFNELLLKLREVHEREMEGWQVKVQELSNKKGCDTKRMEELFTRNQQMKEQQRILTENIKTLENRLRAGLCDRCTVTQEVARRRQQEFEASQIQSLQHISLLTAEMTTLKKENRRLRDDIRTLKAALSSSGTDGGKPLSSPLPERPPSAGGGARSSLTEEPAGGDSRRRPEEEQQDGETEGKTQRTTSQSHLDSYKHLLLPTTTAASVWRLDHDGGRATERRAPEGEVLGQRPSLPPQSTSKSFPPPPGAEVKAGRHLLHAPVPRHPQPIKASPLSVPWPIGVPSDWLALAAISTPPLVQAPPRIQMSPFPSLSPRRPLVAPKWQKQSPPPVSKEPTVVVSLSALPDPPSKVPDQEESPLSKGGRGLPAGVKESCDTPLDLSDRGKTKSGHTVRGGSPWASPGAVKVKKSSDAPGVMASPLRTAARSASPEHLEPVPATHHTKEEDVGGATEQETKKVPVLTISLRPVVVLESLNSALQKQESLSSNGKAPSPTDKSTCSSETHDNKESDSDSEHNNKRKRSMMDADKDGEPPHADNQERKFKVTARAEEKSNG